MLEIGLWKLVLRGINGDIWEISISLPRDSFGKK